MKYILLILLCPLFTHAQTTCIKPVITTSGNQSLKLNVGSTTFTATATGQNGEPTITDYSWLQLSGPTATLTNNDTKTVGVTFTSTGVYTFMVEATDSCGAYNYAYDTLTISNTTSTVTIVPNPVAENKSITVTINVPNTGSGQIYIYNAVAAQVKKQNFNKPSSKAVNVTVSMSRMVPGNYALVVRMGVLSISVPFVVD